jgi:hypothetical protein
MSLWQILTLTLTDCAVIFNNAAISASRLGKFVMQPDRLRVGGTILAPDFKRDVIG